MNLPDYVNKERKWCVYVHTNKINGKKYIGQTSRKPEARWGNNGNGYKNKTPHFYNAIEKWGWNNFDHKIVTSNLTHEEANQMEKDLIKLYNTTNRDYGYNHSKGGTGGNNKSIRPIKKYDLDGNFIKYYESASEAAKDIGCDRSRITHCCKSRLTYKGFMYRYADDAVDGKYIDKRKVPILQYDTEGNFIQKYDSCADAARNINGCKSTIHKAAKASVKHYAYGYLWFDANISKEEIDLLVKEAVALTMQQSQRTVYQYDLDYNLINEFPSITNAAANTECSHDSIYRNCHNYIKSIYGYIFSFIKYENNIRPKEGLFLLQ